MQDAITNVINQADVQGLYLDSSSMGRLEQYFASGELRVRAAATISANASAIIKEAVAKSLLYSDITRPGGNMYTTRRYQLASATSTTTCATPPTPCWPAIPRSSTSVC